MAGSRPPCTHARWRGWRLTRGLADIAFAARLINRYTVMTCGCIYVRGGLR